MKCCFQIPNRFSFVFVKAAGCDGRVRSYHCKTPSHKLQCVLFAVQALAAWPWNTLCLHPHWLDPGFLKWVIVPQAPVIVMFPQVIDYTWAMCVVLLEYLGQVLSVCKKLQLAWSCGRPPVLWLCSTVTQWKLKQLFSCLGLFLVT